MVMKIKGIRHVGMHVDNKDFSLTKNYFIKRGGEVISDTSYDRRYQESKEDIHTCKIQFEDGSILELTTDYNHVAFNVDKRFTGTDRWQWTEGILMELVYDKE
jgi:hypothetical protein